MRKHLFFASLILSLFSIFGFVYARNSNLVTQQIEVKSPLRSVRHQAAIRGNHVIEVKEYRGKEYGDLRSLALASNLVFIGVPQQSNVEIDMPKETTISTVYSVQLLDVFKGNIEKGNDFRVRAPGGLIKFENEKIAEMKLPEGWRNPQIGARYIFFVVKKGNDYVITGGPQGLFQVMDNNTLEPQSNYPAMQSIRGKTVDNLINEIR